MEKLLLLALFILPVISEAQKVKESTDKLTGEKTYYTTSQKLYAKASWSGTVGEQLYFNAVKTPHGSALIMYVQTAKVGLFAVPKGLPMYIKFSSGAIDTLYSIDTEASGFIRGEIGTAGSPTYPLSDRDIQLLKAGDIKFIRIKTDEYTFDYDIKGKFADAVKESLEALKF